MDSSGNFVITWSSLGQDEDNYNGFNQYNVYAQRYNSSGVAQGSEFRVNSANYDPSVAMNRDGNFVITWQSWGQDGSEWGIYADRFIVNNSTVVALNDTATVNEDSSKLINVLANDKGDGPTITGSTAGAHGSTQGTLDGITTESGPWNGIVYTPDPNYFGTDSFTYSISDGRGRTATGTVNVDVLSVNDAPSFTKGADQSVNANAGPKSIPGWATNISVGPSNETSQSREFLVSNNNSLLFATQPAINANGTLTYAPAASASGTATVTVRLRDSGGTVNKGTDTSGTQQFTITVHSVTPANHAPVANAGPDQKLVQRKGASSVQLNGSASSDVDGDSLTYQWREAGALLGTGVLPTVSLMPGVHTIELTVTNPKGASSTDTVMVTIGLPPTGVGASVSGSGTLNSTSGKVSIKFSATSSKTSRGNVSYSDSRTGFKFQATQITSVSVDGRTGLIHGKGKVNGRDVLNFVLTVVDNSPATLKSGDTVTLEVSNGYNFSSTMSKGDVRVMTGS